MDDGQWWFNLRTQQVEEGQGDPNAERLGPYATRDEAEGVLARMRDAQRGLRRGGRRLSATLRERRRRPAP